MSQLSLPFLFLLHGMYLIYCSLPPNPFRTVGSRPASSSKAQRAPPRHVALLLVAPPEELGEASAHPDRTSRFETREEELRDGMLACIERVVGWADEEGVEEVTIFEGGHNPHLLEGLHSPLLSLLTQTPPSPPHSTPSSPPSPTSSSANLDDSSMTKNTRNESSSQVAGPSSPSQGVFRNGMASLSVWSPTSVPDHRSSTPTESSLRKRATSSSPSSSRTSRPHRPITLNLLLPSTSYTLLSEITRSLAFNKTEPKQINVNLIQSLVDKSLPFLTTTEPELLLIHHLAPARLRSSSFLSNLVHRCISASTEPEPVELYGFPPWLLRLTEIHQPPMPPPSFFRPPRSRSRSASVRVIVRDAWEGGMCAWEGVEQRFGR